MVSKPKKAATKTHATKVSVRDYVATVENERRRKEAETLVKLFASATGWKATMWGPSIVGYGRYSYTYDSGHSGDMCVVGFSPRKGAISLYLHTRSPETQALVGRLGKLKKTVGCIYVNKLADIDLGVLEKLIETSVAFARREFASKGWPVSAA
jgi:hypothetical protein